MDVLGVEPDLVSNFEIWLGHDLGVMILCLSLKCLLNIKLEIRMEVLEFLNLGCSCLVGLGEARNHD